MVRPDEYNDITACVCVCVCVCLVHIRYTFLVCVCVLYTLGSHYLHGHVKGRDVEGLEKDLTHFLAIHLGVQRGLRHQHRMLVRHNTELIEESVVPNFFLYI